MYAFNIYGGYDMLKKWNDKYLIGVKEIDEQHKELFSIANEAYDLLKNPFYVDKYNKIISILEKLRNYAVFHFKTEEDYMISIKYNKFFSQKIEHDSFIEKVSKIDFKTIDQNQDEYIISILEFVVNWIDGHILGADKLIEK